MAKLSLKANPTFKAKVGIPVAGGSAVDVEFTFKHRTQTALTEWLGQPAREDVTAILEMAEAWDLVEPFNQENVELLIENHGGAAERILKTYLKELTAGRLGN